MYDLFEALNRAHKLDESSSEWFTKMKNWLKETRAEEEEFFWSDYHDYVDEIYGEAIEKVTEGYAHINVGFEFSTQAGRGMCQVFGSDDDGSGEYTWDFEEDREAVFEFVNESASVEQLFSSLVDYLSGKVDCIQWEDNYDNYDDEEDFDEALDRAHELDEAGDIDRTTIKVRIKELINQVDWSRWDAMIAQHDAHQPEIKKTKTLPNGLRVDVYLGWDYGSKLGYKEYEAQVARTKFDAFRAIVEKNEPNWSIKFTKSYGSRGASWTNYWAQITVVDGAHELDEALVTDYMDSNTLHRAMQHPMFGTFNAYNQEENMIVKTTTNHGAFGGVNQSHRYFKFVRGEDGWEAYEVSSTGDKVGDTFLIDNI